MSYETRQLPSYHPVLAHGDIIIGVDPGETTGYAAARVSYPTPTEQQLDWLKVEEVPWHDRFNYDYTNWAVKQSREDVKGMTPIIAGQVVEPAAIHIVIERFTLYESKAEAQINDDFPSSQVISLVQYAALRNGLFHRIAMVPAAVIKHVTLDEPIRLACVGSEHKKDACKHITRFFRYHAPKRGVIDPSLSDW